jgi:hypothetical protein
VEIGRHQLLHRLSVDPLDCGFDRIVDGRGGKSEHGGPLSFEWRYPTLELTPEGALLRLDALDASFESAHSAVDTFEAGANLVPKRANIVAQLLTSLGDLDG